jgi:methylase of polypeptide subunit release factors
VRHDEAVTTGLLDARGTEQLRAALRGFTVDAVHERLGLPGQAALDRGDLRGAARSLHGGDDPLATLIRLFLLGEPVPEPAARAALDPLPLPVAGALLTRSGSEVRALVDVRPYAEQGAAGPGGRSGGADWWVVSDFGSDVRGGPLAADHVLGVGAASLTLAQATPRDPVGRALDVGTGCGVQALHLARHAGAVVATDVSARALRMAATTAALSGQAWDLRAGSLLEPVAGERFDLVVANPPFVVSAGAVGHEYRDGGRAGDGISEALVRGLPDVLADGGTAQLLANWVITAEQAWDERVAGWLAGSGCDAWVWQREVAEPGEYVTLWLRDAGETPGTPRWAARYDEWLDWFAAAGVVAVGMGLVTLWRGGSADPVVVCEDVPQAVEQPVGAQFPAWIARQRWLRATPDADLLASRLRAAPGLVLDRSALLGGEGWQDAVATLRQAGGLRWSVEVDEAIALLVAGCADGTAPLAGPVTVLGALLERPPDEIAAAVLPVVRDLVGRGFLLPEGGR